MKEISTCMSLEKMRLLYLIALVSASTLVGLFTHFKRTTHGAPKSTNHIWRQLRKVPKNFSCRDIPELVGSQLYRDTLQLLLRELEAYNRRVSSVSKANARRGKANCMEGHVARYMEEVYVLWELARLDKIKVICETGFNAGHSTLIWLLAKPDNVVYSFDLGRHSCSVDMAKYLQGRFPGRLNVTWGDSTATLPKFRRDHPEVKCDLMSVDGGHTVEISQADMDNFIEMQRGEDNIVLLDNHPDRRYKLDITWDKTKAKGLLREVFRCSYEPTRPQGFTLGQFIHDSSVRG